MVVDDSKTDRRMLQHALERVGYVVTATGDPLRALELLTAGNFDLALIDVNMAGMNGLELLENVRRRPHLRDLAVVMMSSDAGEKRIVR